MVISRRFIQHARDELENGNRLQASEKTWGAMAHVLKAIAEERGWQHRGHLLVLDTGRHIGKEFNHPDVILATEKANGLHSNFYDNSNDAEAIEESIDQVEDVLPDLEEILKMGPLPFTIGNRSDRRRLYRLTENESLRVGDTSSVGFSLRHSPNTGNGG